MSFVYPNFLWALLAVLIPIIIHFFNFRTYRTVYFSNVSFLDNIEQESKSRNKLRDLLILLFRILTIVSLVFAFAKPEKLDKRKEISNCKNIKCIYLDNSFSMNALNKDGSSIEVAKSRATDIVRSQKQDTKYLFVTNNFNSQEQHFYIAAVTKENISKTVVSPISRNLSFVVGKIENIVEEKAGKNCFADIYLISDFQKNILDFQKIKNDTNFNIYIIPISPNSAENLYLDTLWFDSPFHLYEAQDSIIVRVVNQANTQIINHQIKLFINDTLKTMSTFNIAAHSSKDVKIVYTNTSAGNIAGRIEIDDYPVIYDNDLYFDYYISAKKKILLIENKKQEMLEKFYSDNKYFDLTICNSSNIPISEFPTFQSIILYSQESLSSGLIEKLHDFAQNGGVIIFIPQNNIKLNSINTFFDKFNLPRFSALDTQKLSINKIDLQDKIYKNSFERIKRNSIFPYVKSHYKIDKSRFFNIRNLLELEDGDVLLYNKKIGLGTIYVFSSNIGRKQSDFMINPLSVPTFYNIPIFSNTYKIPYYIIGQNRIIEYKNIRVIEALKLENTVTGFTFFPQIRKITPDFIKFVLSNIDLKAGNYNIYSGNNKIGLVSFNYSRTESDLQYLSHKKFEKELEKYKLKNWKIYNSKGLNLQNKIRNADKGKYYWKFFIILALIFILLEILTIKLFKNKKYGK